MIIFVTGPCGVGKTLLSNKLSKHYSLKVFRIGDYRNTAYKKYRRKHKDIDNTWIEACAWVDLASDLLKLNLNNFLMDSTGANKRQKFIYDILNPLHYIILKLECNDKVLKKRLAKKKKSEGYFPFPYYKSKKHFNKSLKTSFKRAPGIRINTTYKTPKQVFKIAKKHIDKHLSMSRRYEHTNCS